MKIAMFGHKRVPSREGGVEIVVEELSARMAALGHQVICYNRTGHHSSGREFDRKKQREYRGIELKFVPTVDRKGLAAVTSSFFAAICAAFSDADVVHIHAEGPAVFSWIPKLSGKRVVVTVHGLDWQREKWKYGLGSRYIRMGERAAVQFADEIIVLSRNMQQHFLNTYGRLPHWIPNGVNPAEILPAEEIVSRFALEKDGYFLFLGRLVPEKGIHYLIDAFRKINTDKKLVIAGGTSDTDAYVEKLKKSAAGDPRILFTGFVQGRLLAELYGNAWVYVLPTDTEGMPLSLLEAMSYGNCCLVSDIPECAEIVGTGAELFPAGNVPALTHALQRLCDDPATVREKKAGARAHIRGRFDWDETVKKTLELYQ